MRIFNRFLMTLPALILLQACGPTAYFGRHELQGSNPIYAKDYAIYYFDQSFTTEGAYCEDDYDCNISRPADYHHVDHEVSLAEFPSGSSGIVRKLDAENDYTGEFYFIFHPSNEGNHRLRMTTSVYLLDRNLENTSVEDRDEIINVLSSPHPRLSVAGEYDTISQLQQDQDSGPPNSFSFTLVPQTSTQSLVFEEKKLSSDAEPARVVFYASNGSYMMNYHGLSYTLPFRTPYARLSAAVEDLDGDGIHSVYVLFEDDIPQISRTVYSRYFLLSLVE